MMMRGEEIEEKPVTVLAHHEVNLKSPAIEPK
jgi:hypothetical protein